MEGFWLGLLAGVVLSIALSALAQRLVWSKQSALRENGDDLNPKNGENPVMASDDHVRVVERKEDRAVENEDVKAKEEKCAGDLSDEEEEEDVQGEERERGEVVKKPVGAPEFPYLKIINLVEGSSPSRIFPNTRKPEAFESSSVRGSAVVALRIKGHEDPFYQAFFEGKNRRLELQFQLTFKTAPRGIIYFGGEVPDKMQLGIVTKSICKGILSILNRLSSSIHASFGKNMENSSEKEYPHIAFPLWTAATSMVITKASGGPLPQLGQEIIETPEHRKGRVKQGANAPGEIQAGDTITFSINSMYVDIVRWKATNLGAFGEMDLSMFWDTMPLNIVMYDLPGFVAKENKVHCDGNRQKYLAFSIENTFYMKPSSDPPVLYLETGQASSKNGNNSSRSEHTPLSSPTGRASTASRSSNADEEVVDYEEEDSEESTIYEDEPLNPTPLQQLRQQSPRSPNGSASSEMVFSTTELSVVAWVEHMGKQKHAVSLVLARRDRPQLYLQSRESFTSSSLPPSLQLVNRELPKRPKKVWEWEFIRGQLENAFDISEPAVLPIGWLDGRKRLLQARSRESMGISVSTKYLEHSRVVAEFPVVRPLWETKWVEEWAVLLEAKSGESNILYLLLYRPKSKVPVLILSSNDVMNVDELVPSYNSFASYFPTLEVETLGHVLLLGFGDVETRGNVAARFRSVPLRIARVASPRGQSANQPQSPQHQLSRTLSDRDRNFSVEREPIFASDMSTISLTYEQNRWGAAKRTILNVRRVIFNSSPRQTPVSSPAVSPSNGSSGASGGNEYNCFKSIAVSPMVENVYVEDDNGTPEAILRTRKRLEQKSGVKPWELSAILLRSALQMDETTSSMMQQAQFLDLASELRNLDIWAWASVMTEEEKLCFTLNLYHSLRMHAKFLVGQPSSILGWSAFGSKISYVVGSGTNAIVLSLAEIEHCILRKPMSLARTLLSTSYPSTASTRILELTNAEPRLNFVLNYGTQSCATKIPVLHAPSSLDRLLDKASAHYLDECLKIDTSRRIISIPKICSWYGRDFVPDVRDTNVKVIGREIVEYVGDEQRDLIEKILEDPELTFRVRSFKWKALERQDELFVN